MPLEIELETLSTIFKANNKDLVNKLIENEKLFIRNKRVADESLNSIGNSLQSFSSEVRSTTLSLVGLEGGLIGISKQAVKLYADAQSLKISFEVMLGSVEKAEKTLNSLYKFAADTPFEIPEVVQASKQMVAFGENAENLVPTMQRLGDVASALEIPLNDLIYVYGTLKSQGNAMTVDIRQFAQRGIPIYLALAKVLRLVDKDAKSVSKSAKAALDKQIESGNVTFEIVEQAFKQMTEAGGQFNGMMERQSKELKGLYSTMRDDVNGVLRDLGKTTAEELKLKEVMSGVSDLAKAFKSMSPETKKVIVDVLAIGTGLTVATTGFIAFKAAVSAAGAVLGTYTTAATAATVATIAFRAALGGIVVYALIQDFKELNKEIEESKKITDKMSSSVGGRFQAMVESSRLLRTEEEKRTYLNQKIKEATDDRNKQLELATAREREYRKVLKENALELGGGIAVVEPKRRGEVLEAQQQFEFYDKLSKSTTKGLRALQDELDGLTKKQKESTQQALNDRDEYIKKLQFETRTLGMTTDAIEVLRLKTQGLTEEDAAQLRVYQLGLKLAKDRQAAIDKENKSREDTIASFDDMLKGLEAEKDALIGGADSYRLIQLEREANRLGISRQTEEVRKQIIQLTEENRLRKIRNDDMKEARGIIDSLKTPLDKFNEEQSRLRQLIDGGHLTWSQFKQAMESAEQRMIDATSAANDLRDAIQGIDAALSNSAEAVSRIRAYKEMLRLQSQIKTGRGLALEAPMPREFVDKAPMPREWRERPLPKIDPPQLNAEQRQMKELMGFFKREIEDVTQDKILLDEIRRQWNAMSVEDRRKEMINYLKRQPLEIAPQPRELQQPVPMMLPNKIDNIQPNKEVVDLLRRIVTNTGRDADEEAVVIKPADLIR